MQSKHICIAANYHYSERIGGSEVQAWLLAEELAKRGYQVSYICESLQNKQNQVEIIDNVAVHWLPHFRLFDIFNAGRYYYKLKSLAPDIIVQRYTSLYSGVIGYFSKRYNKPYLWICADDQIPRNDLFKHRLKTSLHNKNMPWLKKIILKGNAGVRDWFRNFGMRQITYPCAQNKIQCELLKQNFNLSAQLFHSGHKVPKTMPIKSQPALILWVGSFAKRPEIFLDLVKKCEHLNVEFVMISKPAGKKDQNVLNKIKDYDAQSEKFTWCGTLSLTETLKWFDKANLFVNTSVIEGFPNTYVQAWLRGVPVMSYEFDPDDIIKTRQLGWVVSGHDQAVELIEKKIMTKDSKVLSDAIYSYATANHSIESVADNFIRITMSEENTHQARQ